MPNDNVKVIVGLGNPGSQYEDTRHNIGFKTLDSFARKHVLAFKKETKFEGALAKGVVEGEAVLLLKPTTYMNASGRAVQKTVQYFKCSIDRLLIVADDAALPLGTLRFRSGGSPGGHNGLKDIEAMLGTKHYARLRLGIGGGTCGALHDHVLGKFTNEEHTILQSVVAQSEELLEAWLQNKLGDQTWHVT